MPTSYSIALIAAAVGIIPVFGWLLFVAKRGGLEIGRLDFFIKVFFIGILTAFVASGVEIFVIETDIESNFLRFMQEVWFHNQTSFTAVAFLSAMLVSVIEEVVKAIGIIFSLGKRKIRTSNEGMIQGMVIGLAFAVTENGVYFASVFQSETGMNLVSIVLLRFLLSTSAHIVYSGIMGLFLAEARLKLAGSGKIVLLVLGFLIPVLMHTVFNFLLGPQYSWVVIVLISFGFLFLWLIYLKNSKKMGLMIL